MDEFFTLAKKYKTQGKDAEYKQMTSKALRLEGSLTQCKPIEIPESVVEDLSKRGDFLMIKKIRRKPCDNPLVKNQDYDELTIKHAF